MADPTDPDDVDQRDITDEPPEPRTTTPTTTPSLWSRLGSNLQTLAVLTLLVGAGLTVWYYDLIPSLPALGGGEVADGTPDEQDDHAPPARSAQRGPIGVSCDDSLPGIRWSQEDDNHSNGDTLSLIHPNGTKWNVHNVFCEGGHLVFANKSGDLKPVLATCLQVAHAPRPGRDHVRVEKTAACPAVTCYQYSRYGCMVEPPGVPAEPAVGSSQVSLDLILKVQGKTLDELQDMKTDFGSRLETLERRVDGLSPPPADGT